METLTSFIKSYYKYFTFTWLFIGSAAFFIDDSGLKKWYYYLILCLLVLVLTLVVFLSKRKITHKIKSLDCAIDIVFADLLSVKDHTIVIPVNDVFDTELGSVISTDSIQGQFTQRVFDSDTARLDSAISDKLVPYEKFSIYDPDKKYGKKKRYPLGTAISVDGNPNYILLTVTRMENDDKKAQKVMADDLWKVLSSLWDFNRRSNSMKELYVPAIATGFGRSVANIVTVSKMILLSFYSKSKEEKISKKLTLVLKSDNKNHLIHELDSFVKMLT